MTKEAESAETLQPQDLKSRIVEYFDHPNIKLVDPININNIANRHPFFIVAGVQVLDKAIHHEEEIPTDRKLVFQPSVRLKFSGEIDLNIPSTTSFINVASLGVNRGIDEHLAETQRWLDFLSSIGLEDISTSNRETVSNWGNGNFFNSVTDFYSDGVHIGDSVYRTEVPQQTRSNLEISDISFGYERLLKASGINEEIFLNSGGSDNTQDLLRTLTLLVGSGNTPSNKNNKGRIIKKLAKGIDDNAPIHDLVYFYHNWWNRFTTIPKKPHSIAEVINDGKFT